ncbi:MAG: DEAD/DEAH box helicase [Prevotellaceae bacterium]|jgi:SNF2 family DNA or RNA helicase|nr:DEAD/DEAH box helicase [Prevotellaceae bacterium]
MKAFHKDLGEGIVIKDEKEMAVIEFTDGKIERLKKDDLEIRNTVEEKIDDNLFNDTERTIARMRAFLIRSINENWGIFSVSSIELLPHQLWVCNTVNKRWPIRYLIADDVGLGKTIEAGLILWPLLDSKRVKRLLVLTPSPSLAEQWETRLNSMFDIRLKCYNAQSDTSGSFYWRNNNLVVASLPTLQSDHNGRHQRLFSSEPFDMVIVDEAHHLNWDEFSGRTLGYEFLEKLQEHNMMTSCVFFTGTPHRGKDYGFFALMRLLDRDKFDPSKDIDDLYKNLSQYLIRNNKQNVTDMKGNKLFKPIIQSPGEFTYTEDEKIFYDKLTEFILSGKTYAHTFDGRERTRVILVLMALQKIASSSIAAIKAALKTRKQTLLAQQEKEEYNLDETDDDDDALRELKETGKDFHFKLMEEEIKNLDELIDLAEAVKQESRITKISEIIKEKYPHESILFFTEYKRTQALMLSELIKIYGQDSVGFINGDEFINGVKFPDGSEHILKYTRKKSAEDFNKGKIRYLVSTEAAGEGIDLQENCHIVIHIDLPWNPMRMHQRTGRINRYGQKKSVEIVSMHNPDTLEGHIWDLLQKKIASIKQMFLNATEDPEDLMELVLGMKDTNFYNRLYSDADRNNLQSWFNSATGTLGDETAVQTINRLVGNAAKFNLAGLDEVPKFDLPDLELFFKSAVKLAKKRITVSPDGKLSFNTPDDWRNEFGIKPKYDNIIFKRKVEEGEICGVGHKIFTKALDFAASFTDDICYIDSMDSFYVYRIYDKLTYQKSAIKNKFIICKCSPDQKFEWISEEEFFKILLVLQEAKAAETVDFMPALPQELIEQIPSQAEVFRKYFREPGYELFAYFAGVFA